MQQTTCLTRIISLSLSFLLLQLVSVARSQESPSLFAEKFDYSKSFRTNVCQQQDLLWNETIDLPNALRGLELTVAITNYQIGKETNLFSLVNNTIRVDTPGFFGIVLDEVAKRAGFRWRNTFGVYLPLDPVTDEGKTWTDILVWAIATYDISMERWAHSVDRMNKGASFPIGYWDSSAVLGEIFQPSQQKRVVNLWSFLKPFELVVWGCIAAAIVVTGMVYWLLEHWNKDTDERELDGKPLASIFYAAIAFTGHYEFRPSSHAARIVGFSFTFWSLIVGSAYTANLASFLVSPHIELYKFSTMKQVLRRDASVCVQDGSVLKQLLKSMYPDLTMVGKSVESDLFQGLRLPIENGGCDAVVHQFNSFELYEHTKEVNYDCAVSSEKRIVAGLPAGMATLVDNGPVSTDYSADSPQKCTSLISHVLDYHLTVMFNEGFIDEAWKKHVEQTGTVQCIKVQNKISDRGLEETYSLTVYDVGGIFTVHAVLSFLAVALATYQFSVKARKEQLEDNRTLGRAFGVHHVMSISKFSNLDREGGVPAESRSRLPTIPENDKRMEEEEDTMEDNSSSAKHTRNTSHHGELVLGSQVDL